MFTEKKKQQNRSASPRLPLNKLNGWLIVDKPTGMTSTDVVNVLKRRFRPEKIGHGGTLDPAATGLLPVALGKATKAVPYIMEDTKHYRFTLRFGEARDTDDAEGEVTALSDKRPTDREILAALPAFTGTIMQVPPAYSAVKVQGQRAYDLARNGQAPVLQARKARIDRFILTERPDEDHAVFEVFSGKGVYMRSLARDLALELGSCGHISALRRLQVGPFKETDMIPLDKLVEEVDSLEGDLIPLLPVVTALADIPALAITKAEAAELRNGRSLHLAALTARVSPEFFQEEKCVRVMSDQQVIGICRVKDVWLCPERLLQGNI